jgi:hypothetical protein
MDFAIARAFSFPLKMPLGQNLSFEVGQHVIERGEGSPAQLKSVIDLVEVAGCDL